MVKHYQIRHCIWFFFLLPVHSVFSEELSTYPYCVENGYPFINGQISSSDVAYTSDRIYINSQAMTVMSSDLAALMYMSLRPKPKNLPFRFDLDNAYNYFRIEGIPRRLTGMIGIEEFARGNTYGNADVLIGRDLLQGHTVELDAFAQTITVFANENYQNEMPNERIQFLSDIRLLAHNTDVKLSPCFSLGCGFAMNRSEIRRLSENGGDVHCTGVLENGQEFVELRNISIAGVNFESVWGLSWDYPNLIGLPILNRFNIQLDMDGHELKLKPNGFANYHDHSFTDGMKLRTKGKSNEPNSKTIYAEWVLRDSTAMKSGLHSSDIIISIDGDRGADLLARLPLKIDLINMPRKRDIKIEAQRSGELISIVLPSDM